jgi:hypothetical protein
VTNEEQFPQELLSKSNDDRVKWFKEVVIADHRKLKDAIEEVRIALIEPPDSAIINLFGPAGAGKSTLLRKVQQAVIRAALPILNPGCIPFILLVAPGPDRGYFDWVDYYTRGLIALKEVLIKNKVYFDEGTGEFKRISLTAKDARELRRIYESTLHYRGVKVVGVDEAHNLATISKGRRLFDQTECVKSLGMAGEHIHILAGSYRLLDLRSLSGQVSRRTASIHFSNYEADRAEDIEEFKSVIKTFQNRLPHIERPDFERHWEYLYLYSCGCVGVLKDWVTKALSLSLGKLDKTVTLHHLEKTALSKKDLDRMSLEIYEGKRRLADEEGEKTLNDVKRRLGLTSTGIKAANNRSTPQPEKSPEAKEAPRGRRVGEPNPQRFEVGNGGN